MTAAGRAGAFVFWQIVFLRAVYYNYDIAETDRLLDMGTKTHNVIWHGFTRNL